ncbi:apoptosis regulator BAX-like [Brienomyrus brachyistius]|uniref:apoptosis regulator BAX-like n=1 Tax=Brienomyrus brachyistius TaxID=42636 RepID=UPI0020B1C7C2|nr:apoptosis regulator BAX-like [Brienomyrus brachyistius]XP_048871602.1 apoptosis regulator BAX-like [Brienomyrus brachyistius]
MAESLEGVGRDTSIDHMLEAGGGLLADFIIDRVRRHGNDELTVNYADLGGTELHDPTLKQVAQCLRQIGDELDNNEELQRMINKPDLQPTKEVFSQVAWQIFSDGKFSWGRVVTLFYFACRLVIKALIKKVPNVIRIIFSWTMDYLRDHVISWIMERGGWEDVRSYFGTPTWQMTGVFVAGILTAFLVIHKM